MSTLKSQWIKIAVSFLVVVTCLFGPGWGFCSTFSSSWGLKLTDQPQSGKLPVTVAEGKRAKVGLTPASKYSNLGVIYVISSHNSLTKLTTTTWGLAASWVLQVLRRKGRWQKGVSEKLVSQVSGEADPRMGLNMQILFGQMAVRENGKEGWESHQMVIHIFLLSKESSQDCQGVLELVVCQRNPVFLRRNLSWYPCRAQSLMGAACEKSCVSTNAAVELRAQSAGPWLAGGLQMAHSHGSHSSPNGYLWSW